MSSMACWYLAIWAKEVPSAASVGQKMRLWSSLGRKPLGMSVNL